MNDSNLVTDNDKGHVVVKSSLKAAIVENMKRKKEEIARKERNVMDSLNKMLDKRTKERKMSIRMLEDAIKKNNFIKNLVPSLKCIYYFY